MTLRITPIHHLAYLQDGCCVRSLHVSGPGLMQALQKGIAWASCHPAVRRRDASNAAS